MQGNECANRSSIALWALASVRLVYREARQVRVYKALLLSLQNLSKYLVVSKQPLTQIGLVFLKFDLYSCNLFRKQGLLVKQIRYFYLCYCLLFSDPSQQFTTELNQLLMLPHLRSNL